MRRPPKPLVRHLGVALTQSWPGNEASGQWAPRLPVAEAKVAGKWGHLAGAPTC